MPLGELSGERGDYAPIRDHIGDGSGVSCLLLPSPCQASPFGPGGFIALARALFTLLDAKGQAAAWRVHAKG